MQIHDNGASGLGRKTSTGYMNIIISSMLYIALMWCLWQKKARINSFLTACNDIVTRFPIPNIQLPRKLYIWQFITHQSWWKQIITKFDTSTRCYGEHPVRNIDQIICRTYQWSQYGRLLWHSLFTFKVNQHVNVWCDKWPFQITSATKPVCVYHNSGVYTFY